MTKIKLIVPLFLIATALKGQTLNIIGLFQDADGSPFPGLYTFELFPDGYDKPLKATTEWTTLNSLCRLKVKKKYDLLRIEISRIGYQKATRNCKINWHNSIGTVNIDPIQFQPLESSISYQLMTGESINRKYISLESVFTNNDKQLLPLSKVTLEMRRYFKSDKVCLGLESDIVGITLDDSIEVIHKDSTLLLEGSYKYKDSLKVKTEGEVRYNICGHYQYMKLTIPLNFKIKPNGSSSLTLVIPETFRFKNMHTLSTKLTTSIKKYSNLIITFSKPLYVTSSDLLQKEYPISSLFTTSPSK